LDLILQKDNETIPIFYFLRVTRVVEKCGLFVTLLIHGNLTRMFFRHLSNSQSAACWVLCGILMYVYGQLEEQELGINDKSKNVENKHFEIGPKPKNR
jgi:hypothetical protein